MNIDTYLKIEIMVFMLQDMENSKLLKLILWTSLYFDTSPQRSESTMHRIAPLQDSFCSRNMQFGYWCENSLDVLIHKSCESFKVHFLNGFCTLHLVWAIFVTCVTNVYFDISTLPTSTSKAREDPKAQVGSESSSGLESSDEIGRSDEFGRTKLEGTRQVQKNSRDHWVARRGLKIWIFNRTNH